MTAPSLVLLGYGGPDQRVPQVSYQIRDGLLERIASAAEFQLGEMAADTLGR